ncbi:hypothetical protein BO70DRAFT_377485 [Aspergillus heteromorphus CBS 117.55]|uniref:Uncharacterized protein n=1 Tax=Aspergillus heteromorphus CBS 117.55 TaxID=1448321 RepID=A0A317WTB4_9EURO|nr:uncharacterized protein BO70DRAFT_377485 [Aspergillus heteromorphus CBS 117.55]PWY89031.1 hypothetical protein BO70DRAFT_377485 [Aspergillus heteromorphus CBS 117.55]
MPSHSIHLSKSFNRKVDELVQKYDRSNEPSPALRDFLRNADGLTSLMNAIRRHVLLVQSRSKDIEDAQITVYDSALLILSNHGDDPRDTGALELYLAEFLGIVPTSPGSLDRQKIDDHVSLESALTRATESGHTTDRTASADEEDKKPDHASMSRNEVSSFDDDRLRAQADRLIEVYRLAKSEYYGEKKRDGVDLLSLVRYLRDTAENTLLYLQANGMADHPLVSDIKYSFEMAKDKAAQLSGGRARHFDEPFKDSGRRHLRHTKRRRSHRSVDSYRPRDYR